MNANGRFRSISTTGRSSGAADWASAVTAVKVAASQPFSSILTDEFWEKETKKDTFTAADGAQQTVDFMHLTQDRADYCRGENFTVAQLSFRGGQTMRFLLPDEGTTLERLLADDTVVGIC